jgi:hypothetical protein
MECLAYPHLEVQITPLHHHSTHRTIHPSSSQSDLGQPKSLRRVLVCLDSTRGLDLLVCPHDSANLLERPETLVKVARNRRGVRRDDDAVLLLGRRRD